MSRAGGGSDRERRRDDDERERERNRDKEKERERESERERDRDQGQRDREREGRSRDSSHSDSSRDRKRGLSPVSSIHSPPRPAPVHPASSRLAAEEEEKHYFQPSSSASSSSSSSSGHELVPARSAANPAGAAVEDFDSEPGGPLSVEEIAPQKAPGTRGEKVRLSTNQFMIHFYPQTIFPHVIEFINPPLAASETAARHRLVNSLKRELDQLLGLWVFEGETQIFSTIQIPQPIYQLTAPGGTIRLNAYKEVETSSFQSPEVQLIVNVLLKRKLRGLKYIQLGKFSNYYKPEAETLRDQSGREMDIKIYMGFTSSITATRSGLQMTVDLAHRVMSRRSVRQVMNEIEERITRGNSSNRKTREELAAEVSRQVNEELRGIVVVAEYNHRIWRIDKIDYSLSISSPMKLKDGSEISFAKYYLDHYGKNAPNRPGLLVHCDKKGKKNDTYLIPDFCYLTGMNERLKSDSRVMQALSKYTRKSPSDRSAVVKKLIFDLLQGKGEATEQERALMNTIIRIEDEPTGFEGRILGPFPIQFQNQPCQHEVSNGRGFMQEVRRWGYFPPPPGLSAAAGSVSSSSSSSAGGRGGAGPAISIQKWHYIYEADQANSALRFLSEFLGVAKQQFVNLPQPELSQVKGYGQWEDALKNYIVPAKPQFVLAHIPNGDEGIYCLFKQFTLAENALPSQAINSVTVDDPKKTRPVAGNALKQVMAKLGYGLWCIGGMTEKMKGCMIIGADVCHESKSKFIWGLNHKPLGEEEGDGMSAAAFTASYDPRFINWHSFLAFQDKNDDYVHGSRPLMAKALTAYYEKNGEWPVSVLVYRDGVGQSQIESFVRKEIKQYQEAFELLKIAPKLTVIVVQKLTNVRLYAVCPRFRHPAIASANTSSRTTTSPATTSSYNPNARCLAEKCDGSVPFHTPPAGTVVDHTITSPLFHDFYMSPTTPPPNATARPTRYISVKDEMEFSSDEIQSLTYRLCFGYYNWNGAVRVPAPVLYAHKLAFLVGKYLRGKPNTQWNGQMWFL